MADDQILDSRSAPDPKAGRSGRMSADQSPVGWSGAGSALPRPAGWTEHRLPLWLRCSMGFVTFMAIGMAAEAAWLAWTGQPAAGVPLAAGAIYLGHVVGLSTRFWWTPRRSRPGTLTATPDGTTGVRFSYSGWPYYWLTAILVMTDLVAVAVTVAAALSATALGGVLAVVVGVLALWIGWFLVTMLRLAPGSIIVSPAGVGHRSLTSTHFIPWDAIVAVTAEWIGTPVIAVKAFPSADTRVRRYLGRFGSGEARFWPFMVIRTGWLASDPTTVYSALSFYQAHPDLRVELATPDALDRINNGRAVGQEQP
jgi:hypothetical protein